MSGDLRVNSIAGAVLASVLGVMGLGIGVDALFGQSKAEHPGYAPEITEDSTGGGSAAPAQDLPPDFGVLYADAAQLADYVSKGEKAVSACGACHNFAAGGPNGLGPNLHDVFGRHSASHPGFSYSEAMQAHNVTWDYLTLNTFLRSPSRAVPGTRMSFAGLPREADRVAVIAYLRSISPNSIPLPAPLPSEQAGAVAPAG